MVISTNMLTGNDYFVYNYTVKFKQKISKFSNFYWNLGNRLTIVCSHPNEKYNLSYSKT